MNNLAQNRSEPRLGEVSEQFIGVPIHLIFPRTWPDLKIFVRRGEKMVFWGRAGRSMTASAWARLSQARVGRIYIKSEDRPAYLNYLSANLGRVILGKNLSTEQRAIVFYDASIILLADCLESGPMKGLLRQEQVDRINHLIQKSVLMLSDLDSLSSVAGLIDHTYQTYSHSLNVFVFAAVLLQSYQLGEADLLEYALGAMLHDIGKRRIADSILNKSEPLTKDEWEMIKGHPVQGAAVCSKISLPRQALEVILFHHERLDGSGYPAGVSGDRISLPVRIISVCDAYEAMTSDRPYRPAMSPYDALALMKGELAPGLDGEVVRRLIMFLSGVKLI